jgi:hypothetical protein
VTPSVIHDIADDLNGRTKAEEPVWKEIAV